MRIDVTRYIKKVSDMKFTSAAAVVAILLSTPAIAQDANWTGLYGGLGLNAGSLTNSGSTDNGSFDTVGLGAGYLWDAGSFAYGGELSYSIGAGRDSSSTVDMSEATFKGILGYQIGKNLVYGSAGVSSYSFSGTGVSVNDQFNVMGIGARRTFLDKYVGVIEMTRSIDDTYNGTSNSLTKDALSVRVDYKF